MHTLALLLAYVASALGTSVVVPQLIRTIRHPYLTGVSPVSWALIGASCLAWLAYGVRASIWPQIPGNVLLCTGAIALVLLVPGASSHVRRTLALFLTMGVVVAVTWLVPPQVAGFVGFGIGLFAAWPQLADSFATWRRREVSGVAVGSWGVRLAAGIGWFTYAVIAHDVPVLFASTIGFVTTVAVLSMEVSARSAARRRAVDAQVGDFAAATV